MRVCLPAPAKSRGCSLGLEITRESTKRPLLQGPVAVRERRVQQRFGIGALTQGRTTGSSSADRGNHRHIS
ncbi:hypothetical protein ILYODFUR_005690 [Ilyodon furcidens]|uniref:Uncharacterized protein n=1 Tax=Ilyodon furcidens TaxID=33524 RepID=A0ABV0SJL9_9TELE